MFSEHNHNILMEEHNECILQVYGGVYEVLSECSSESLVIAADMKKVTSYTLVGLNAILGSLNLPKDGLSGLLLNFYWHDGLLISC